MSEFGKFHRADNEALHRQLYLLHEDLCWKALLRVKESLLILHHLEVKYADVRAVAHEYIQLFETVRSDIEKAAEDASKVRLKLIEQNGCDATCQAKNDTPVQ